MILVMYAAGFLRAADIALPAHLSAYEDFAVRKIESGVTAPKEDGKIRVLIAAGETDTVTRHEEMEIPSGSNVVEAASHWGEAHGTRLLGWAQGLVVIRRRVGDKVERIAWTMREARTEAPKFKMQNGDVLIGLAYADF